MGVWGDLGRWPDGGGPDFCAQADRVLCSWALHADSAADPPSSRLKLSDGSQNFQAGDLIAPSCQLTCSSSCAWSLREDAHARCESWKHADSGDGFDTMRQT